MMHKNGRTAHLRHLRWTLIALIALLTACTLPLFPSPTPTPTPTRTPTPTPTPPPTPTSPPPDTGWLTVADGVEVRQRDIPFDAGVERATIVRLHPELVTFRVLYAPGEPRTVRRWAAETDALLTVNGGYFTEEYRVVGLTISNGEKFGALYGDFAGLFAVTDEGEVSIRWMREQPYDPAEALREAIQSFPVLVKPGGVMGFPADADDGRPARRTVIAQDREGRILIVAAPRGYASLHEMAVWLTTSDLDITVALNLDGGASTGLWLPRGPLPVQIDSAPVPSVLIVTR